MPSKMWDEIIYPFPNFNGYTIEVWERISHFIAHIIMHVITYPCWIKKISLWMNTRLLTRNAAMKYRWAKLLHAHRWVHEYVTTTADLMMKFVTIYGKTRSRDRSHTPCLIMVLRLIGCIKAGFFFIPLQIMKPCICRFLFVRKIREVNYIY